MVNKGNPAMSTSEQDKGAGKSNDINMEDVNSLRGDAARKRMAFGLSGGSENDQNLAGQIVLADGKSNVANMIGVFDEGKIPKVADSPQKNANKKKLRVVDGTAVDNSEASNSFSRSMNILSLNCRGGGRPETVREISDLIRLQRPGLVFLSETKMSDKRAQDLRWKFGFSNAFGVKSVGLSGGLCMYWNNDSQVTSEILQ
jgi:hypothetical protein